MSDELRRPLTELVFLPRRMLALSILLVVVIAATVGVGGTLLVRVQHHFAAGIANGGHVGALGTLLGRGSGPATAAAGWVAALLFCVALVRLQRGPLEPPAGTRPVERQSVSQLRRGLRREYTIIRVALVIVLLVAALDVARLLAMTVAVQRGDRLLSGALGITAVEAAGLVAATVALGLWARSFGRRLQQLGAF
jgi:hypothetical protein